MVKKLNKMKKAPVPKCVECKFIDNEIDEETGRLKCYSKCPYRNTITLMEKWG